ncbi:hypothetical protein PLEOSDRAFT_160850 [Pleurotus ostreatus PC15]|uniref:Uncharacterized protein n=1 Tax=Pleurotus ostreatus (strain PC15) TaxID=1137138 RepID=A0A067NAQ6_PLEO1|nr:hypothetical protein PLEOSDRAFT_160850 [Pleurotus ostreatus PC15]
MGFLEGHSVDSDSTGFLAARADVHVFSVGPLVDSDSAGFLAARTDGDLDSDSVGFLAAHTDGGSPRLYWDCSITPKQAWAAWMATVCHLRPCGRLRAPYMHQQARDCRCGLPGCLCMAVGFLEGQTASGVFKESQRAIQQACIIRIS